MAVLLWRWTLLPSPVTDPWDDIAPIAEEQFDAKVSILDTHNIERPTSYDPSTDTGKWGAPVVVATDQDARVQQISLGTYTEISYDPTTEVLFRIQLKKPSRGGYAGKIERKFQIRVTNGGKNPELTTYLYEVRAFGNSDKMQVRDIYCVVPLEAVIDSPALVTNEMVTPTPDNINYWTALDNLGASIEMTDDGYALRVTRVSDEGAFLGGVFYHSDVNAITYVPGQVHTIKATAVSSEDVTLLFTVARSDGPVFDENESGFVPYPGGEIVLVQGQEAEITVKVTIPSSDDPWTNVLGPSFALASLDVEDWPVEAYVEFRNLMWVVGDYDGQFADGYSEGWSWSGSPNDSRSTGPVIPTEDDDGE